MLRWALTCQGPQPSKPRSPNLRSNCVATTIIRVLVVNFADVRSDWLVSGRSCTRVTQAVRPVRVSGGWWTGGRRMTVLGLIVVAS